MGKTITINQNSLLAIKESMVGINDVSHNNVCVNEAAPEVDEFELGQESDNPPVGGNYAHVEENKLVTESKNSSRAHRQTRRIIAQYMGANENDPSVIKAEQTFEAKMFGEGKRVDWMIVLEPLAYDWYLQCENINVVQGYLDYIYLKGTESTPPSAYIANIKKFADFNELKQFLDKQKKADDAASMEAQANMEVNLNQNYEVRGPLSFDEAREIGEYSNPDGQICYTQDENIWDSDNYGNYDTNKCYVLLRNDWQNVKPNHDGSEVNNGLPSPLNQYNGYDNYGLSMIFVWIGRFGNLTVSNTRWNHDANYAPGHSVDRALTELDIARLMGAPFEQVFGVKKIDIDDYVQKGLDSNMDIQDIFDEVWDESCGLRCVGIGNKYNYIASENRNLYGYDYKYLYLLWDKPYEEWFDDASDFNEKTNLGTVEVNGKTYFIDKYVKLYDVAETTKKWLADGKTDMFLEVEGDGAIVKVTYDYIKFNYVNTNDKKLLWDKPYEEWFDSGRRFRPHYDDKYVLVKLNNDLYFLDTDGNLSDITETVKKRLKTENPLYIFDTVEDYGVNSYDIHMVELFHKYNFINIKTDELLWDKPYDRWFDVASSFGYFPQDIANVEIGGKHYFFNKFGQLLDTNGNIVESKVNKKILVSESRLKAIKENIESEVESSEIDLSSFKKRSELAPIWKDGNTLDSRVRLRLLDIADDFWEFVNLTWVKPSGIILTGSICNFNWSKYSDIDLHLIVDFDEIDEKTEFVQDYLDSKKNEWNNEHNGLTILGFPVELYVQNLGDMPNSGGVYDLEENAWIKKPNASDIKPIGLDKFSIKDKAAEIMTIIDDMYNALSSEDDMHRIEEIGEDAHYLWKKVKNMRQTSLEKNGESGAGNIVYKILRRMDYLDKLWKLSTLTYDKTNSIEEGKKIYISENKLALLTESQESKSISAAKKLAMQRLGYNEQEADEFVRVKLRNDIPSLRTPEGGKFILGVTRMFCDGEINDAETIGNLNKTIKLVASDAHINEYDRNLNGMSAQDLISPFEGARGEMLDADKQELASMVFETNNDYEIVRIDSFEQSSQYGEYVSWCVTHDESMFNSYTSNGINQFYFCLKNGWNNEELFPKTEGENCPLDEYGLSMIAVSVDGDGGLNTCTCRWNHDNGGNDGIMDTKQISTVIGRNFYDVFKPNNKWKNVVNYAKERLANGEDPRDVFDWCDDYYSNGFLVVELGHRKNYAGTNGQILSDKWFDQCYKFDESNFGMVKFKERWNFIDKNGQLLSKQWFDEIDSFYEGWAYVKLNGKQNFINTEGQLLWNKPIDQWFDEIYAFNGGTINLSNGTYKNEGFARFRLNDKWNFINTEGQLLWNKPIDQWFDGVRDFEDNFGFVEINSKWNFIDSKGQLLWNKPIDQWFDGVSKFDGSCAIVRIGYKRNFINTEGQLLWNKPIDQWFDNITEYRGRFVGKVSIGNKWNFIDSKGQLLWNKPADQWFDYITNFVRGCAEVRLNGNIYTIDTNGNLTLKESENTYNLPYLNESVKKYLTLLKEEVVADGSSEGNPYKKRWKAERDALKNFIANYGKLMQSKEDDKGGKLYKVFYDKTMSELIGYNYCICVQYDEVELKPKSTVYIRALDKFTPFIRRNLQYDDRGFDNQRGTVDDLNYRNT